MISMKPAQIFIVGMHRSGTSAVTNLLANMGAYFGRQDESIGSNPENPKGFWERRDVRRVNDELLHSLGCEWDALTHWDLQKLQPETVSNFRKQVREIYNRLEAASRSCVIKDPRLCLLLPLWLECSSNPIVIYVHRNPEEIARSLLSRNGYPLSFGLKLWESYATHALHHAQDTRSMFVDYERVITDEFGEACRIYRFLDGCGLNNSAFINQESMLRTIEPSLRNQQASLGESVLSEPQKKLKSSLEALCGGETMIPDHPLVLARSTDREECLRALEKYHRVKVKYDELQLYKDQLKDKIKQLDDSVRPLRRQYHSLQYERNLLKRFDMFPRWFVKSYIVRLIILLLKPLSRVSVVSRLLNYHNELSRLIKKI